eukprot:TRINITY_DN16157_c0_g1_i1.p1 TRINITY_DN16157_c0_g1~~TRINITY_DN16157_c0_g1_i1.p1  ORF type:complete len:856 (-),score=76.19 TRINITY_DN16157_c0_g1_i1:277-2844(-)
MAEPKPTKQRIKFDALNNSWRGRGIPISEILTGEESLNATRAYRAHREEIEAASREPGEVPKPGEAGPVGDEEHDSHSDSGESTDSGEEKERTQADADRIAKSRHLTRLLSGKAPTASIRRLAEQHEEDTLPQAWRLHCLTIAAAAIMGCLSFMNTATLGFASKLRVSYLIVVMEWFEAASETLRGLAGLSFWIVWEVGLVCLAHVIARQQPMSFGSGIPEVRVEMQGTHLKGYYTPRVFVAKAFGLLLTECSGMPTGKEGPFVHMASMTSFGLLKSVPALRKVREIHNYMYYMLMASAACATCSTFGVPIGSVLFALEVMPDTQWTNVCYWTCLGSAVAGSLVLKRLEFAWSGSVSPISVSLLPFTGGINLEPNTEAWVERLVFCTVLGSLCGLFGAFFVKAMMKLQKAVQAFMNGGSALPNLQPSSPQRTASRFQVADGVLRHNPETPGHAHTPLLKNERARMGSYDRGNRRIANLKRNLSTTWKQRALLLCACGGIMSALVTFTIPILRGIGQYDLIWLLVSTEDVNFGDATSMGAMTKLGANRSNVPRLTVDEAWEGVPAGLAFTLLLCVKTWLTMFLLVLPLPSGCIVPLYLIGAILGRAFGELAAIAFPNYVWVTFRSDLSLVGATAVTAAVCRSFSVVVVVVELLGLHDRVLPLSAAAIFAINVANLYSPSIFEAILRAKRLPGAPQARTIMDGVEPVSMVMQSISVPVLPETLGLGEEGVALLQRLLQHRAEAHYFVVTNGSPGDYDTSVVVGLVARSDAEKLAESPAPADEDVKISRDVIFCAPQVPPWMPMKDALSVLEIHKAPMILVTDAGRLEGTVTYEYLLSRRHDGTARSMIRLETECPKS